MPSASYSDGFSIRPFTLRLSLSTNDNESQNRSTVNWTLRIEPPGNWYSYSFFSNPWSVSIDGNTSSGNFTYDFRPPNNNSTITIASGSRTINHNSDGSKTITVRASATGSSIGSADTGNNSFKLTTYERAPSTPSSISVSRNIRDITVSLGASSDAGAGITRYRIQKRQLPPGGSYSAWGDDRTTTTSDRTTTYTSLLPDYTYQFRGRAEGPGGNSDWRTSGETVMPNAATAPSSISTIRTLRSVEVTLGASTPLSNDITINSYTIQRRESTNGGSTWGAWGGVLTADVNRKATFTGLNSESTYQFRGRANTDLGSSAYTTSGSIFIPGNPDPPSEVLAILYGTAVLVIIYAPTSDGGAPVLTYTVQKRESLDKGATWSDWTTDRIIPAASASFIEEDADIGTTYQYQVFASNEQGDSESATQSDEVYIPRIVRIYNSETASFRNPFDYKRYDATMDSWVGLSIAKKYSNGEWVDLD